MKNFLNLVIFAFFLSASAYGLDSLSYSGRLVNADGSPVTGTPDIQFNLSYTNAPSTIICTKTVTSVPLTKGVFHTKLDYIAADCGGQTLSQVLSLVPVGETIALQVTDITNSKAYTYQAIHSIPSSIMSNIVKNPYTNGSAEWASSDLGRNKVGTGERFRGKWWDSDSS